MPHALSWAEKRRPKKAKEPLRLLREVWKKS